MSRFYFGGSDSESGGEEDALPYPKPLARSAFLTQDFSPTAFLSSLSNRHQTLEDLRSELRTRSQELNKELLDLVNENYQDFLGLGASLTGGDEKVEEVRVGLLSFRRDIEGLKSKVTERREEVEGLVEEKKQVAARIRTARALLEVDSRLDELEHSLAITEIGDTTEEQSVSISESEDTDDDEVGRTFSVAKLRYRVQQFVGVKKQIKKLDPEHPFLTRQAGRVQKIRETLLLDMNAALVESKRARESDNGPVKILALYRILDEPSEAVKVLKDK